MFADPDLTAVVAASRQNTVNFGNRKSLAFCRKRRLNKLKLELELADKLSALRFSFAD